MTVKVKLSCRINNLSQFPPGEWGEIHMSALNKQSSVYRELLVSLKLLIQRKQTAQIKFHVESLRKQQLKSYLSFYSFFLHSPWLQVHCRMTG